MPGIRVRVALLELQFARDEWLVISPAGIEGPFLLPGSHGAWAPVATAESYAETTRCNSYAYQFSNVQLGRDDGGWSALRRAETLQDPGWRVRRHGAGFSATAT